MIRRALLSVSDKQGLVDFARGLADLGIEIISTGGTAAVLRQAGVRVISVSSLTGFPEILDGRVKTLHPFIHGAILARRGEEKHRRQLEEAGIGFIDLVVINLYPFQATIERGASLEEALENIDIGGPALIRAAAKNHPDVVVVVDPRRYPEILAEIQQKGDISSSKRLQLAVEAFQHTAYYDSVITGYLREQAGGDEAVGAGEQVFPDVLSLAWEKVSTLRYGENPHQAAAFYRQIPGEGPLSLAAARQLQGKELSFNNLNDAGAAVQLAAEFRQPAAVAVKHTNPCGVALADNALEAYRRAHAADPVSIFGGIVALNRPVNSQLARELAKTFLEVIIAPSFQQGALAILGEKKNLRLLALEELGGDGREAASGIAGFLRERPAGRVPWDLKGVPGGILLQEQDIAAETPDSWKVVTRKQPDHEEWQDMLFAWIVAKHVKSNAIVIARGMQTVGVGAGQMNRIDAARIAIQAAGHRARGAVLASDAFFPFPDVVEAAAEAGLSVLVQPGGSIRDQESVDRADELGLAMVFTGRRHFKH